MARISLACKHVGVQDLLCKIRRQGVRIWCDCLHEGREQPFKPSGNWRCKSGQAVLDAALRGFGLCQLPDYYVQEPLRRGELVSLLETNRPPNTAVWAVYPQRRYPLPKVRLLIQALKDGLARRPEYLHT